MPNKVDLSKTSIIIQLPSEVFCTSLLNEALGVFALYFEETPRLESYLAKFVVERVSNFPWRYIGYCCTRELIVVDDHLGGFGGTKFIVDYIEEM